jgi:hypothetical protein
MLKKIQRVALSLVVVLAAVAFASPAGASTLAWIGQPSSMTVSISKQPLATPTGDPDVPGSDVGQQNKKLSVAVPSDGFLHPTSMWFGQIWLRVYLSRWFGR